jgi:hypothetical protein
LDPWIDSDETVILDEDCEGKSPIEIDDLNQYVLIGAVENTKIAKIGAFTGSVSDGIDTSVAGIQMQDTDIPLVLEASKRVRISATGSLGDEESGVIYL